uniref:Uncharacterized protein LOC116953596 n=1 Tax=Petromyzon marinus TaxID=7757 RepID=A0AAJ7U4R8_PETMA|nr:uncharacterized protein LOC116953596 [Petromyzon marinus]
MRRMLPTAAACGPTPDPGTVRSHEQPSGAATVSCDHDREFSITETNFAEGGLKLKIQSMRRGAKRQQQQQMELAGLRPTAITDATTALAAQPAIRITIRPGETHGKSQVARQSERFSKKKSDQQFHNNHNNHHNIIIKQQAEETRLQCLHISQQQQQQEEEEVEDIPREQQGPGVGGFAAEEPLSRAVDKPQGSFSPAVRGGTPGSEAGADDGLATYGAVRAGSATATFRPSGAGGERSRTARPRKASGAASGDGGRQRAMDEYFQQEFGCVPSVSPVDLGAAADCCSAFAGDDGGADEEEEGEGAASEDKLGSIELSADIINNGFHSKAYGAVASESTDDCSTLDPSELHLDEDIGEMEEFASHFRPTARREGNNNNDDEEEEEGEVLGGFLENDEEESGCISADVAALGVRDSVGDVELVEQGVVYAPEDFCVSPCASTFSGSVSVASPLSSPLYLSPRGPAGSLEDNASVVDHSADSFLYEDQRPARDCSYKEFERSLENVLEGKPLAGVGGDVAPPHPEAEILACGPMAMVEAVENATVVLPSETSCPEEGETPAELAPQSTSPLPALVESTFDPVGAESPEPGDPRVAAKKNKQRQPRGKKSKKLAGASRRVSPSAEAVECEGTGSPVAIEARGSPRSSPADGVPAAVAATPDAAESDDEESASAVVSNAASPRDGTTEEPRHTYVAKEERSVSIPPVLSGGPQKPADKIKKSSKSRLRSLNERRIKLGRLNRESKMLRVEAMKQLPVENAPPGAKDGDEESRGSPPRQPSVLYSPLYTNVSSLTVQVPEKKRRGRPRKELAFSGGGGGASKCHARAEGDDAFGRTDGFGRDCVRIFSAAEIAMEGDELLPTNRTWGPSAVPGDEPRPSAKRLTDRKFLKKINKMKGLKRERILSQILSGSKGGPHGATDVSREADQPTIVATAAPPKVKKRQQIHVSKKGTIYVGKKRGRKPKAPSEAPGTAAVAAQPRPPLPPPPPPPPQSSSSSHPQSSPSSFHASASPFSLPSPATTQAPGFSSGLESPASDVGGYPAVSLLPGPRPSRILPTKAMLKFSGERPNFSPPLPTSPSHCSEISLLKEATPSPISESHSEETIPSDSGIGTDNNSVSGRADKRDGLRTASAAVVAAAVAAAVTAAACGDARRPGSFVSSASPSDAVAGPARPSPPPPPPPLGESLRRRHRSGAFRQDKLKRPRQHKRRKKGQDPGFLAELEELTRLLARCRVGGGRSRRRDAEPRHRRLPSIFCVNFPTPRAPPPPPPPPSLCYYGSAQAFRVDDEARSRKRRRGRPPKAPGSLADAAPDDVPVTTHGAGGYGSVPGGVCYGPYGLPYSSLAVPAAAAGGVNLSCCYGSFGTSAYPAARPRGAGRAAPALPSLPSLPPLLPATRDSGTSPLPSRAEKHRCRKWKQHQQQQQHRAGHAFAPDGRRAPFHPAGRTRAIHRRGDDVDAKLKCKCGRKHRERGKAKRRQRRQQRQHALGAHAPSAELTLPGRSSAPAGGEREPRPAIAGGGWERSEKHPPWSRADAGACRSASVSAWVNRAASCDGAGDASDPRRRSEKRRKSSASSSSASSSSRSSSLRERTFAPPERTAAAAAAAAGLLGDARRDRPLAAAVAFRQGERPRTADASPRADDRARPEVVHRAKWSGDASGQTWRPGKFDRPALTLTRPHGLGHVGQTQLPIHGTHRRGHRGRGRPPKAHEDVSPVATAATAATAVAAPRDEDPMSVVSASRGRLPPAGDADDSEGTSGISDSIERVVRRAVLQCRSLPPHRGEPAPDNERAGRKRKVAAAVHSHQGRTVILQSHPCERTDPKSHLPFKRREDKMKMVIQEH